MGHLDPDYRRGEGDYEGILFLIRGKPPLTETRIAGPTGEIPTDKMREVAKAFPEGIAIKVSELNGSSTF